MVALSIAWAVLDKPAARRRAGRAPSTSPARPARFAAGIGLGRAEATLARARLGGADAIAIAHSSSLAFSPPHLAGRPSRHPCLFLKRIVLSQGPSHKRGDAARGGSRAKMSTARARAASMPTLAAHCLLRLWLPRACLANLARHPRARQR
eukprot:7802257-Pyramimonas_sp.AAC.1